MAFATFRDRMAADASAGERAEFIRQTYLHLGGAVVACVALTALLVQVAGQQIASTFLGSTFSWFIVLGAFMVAGRVAQGWAQSGGAVGKQYAGLALYVAIQSLILVPICYIATKASPGVLPKAAILTLMVFGGLTATVFITKKDFSFMSRALMIGSFGAMGLIVVSMIFGFNLGTLFSAAMVILMAGYILYYTGNVMNNYPVGSHVAASLALFSSIATLFFYILQLVMGDD
jgi:FtsH-binding integral membrane protein